MMEWDWDKIVFNSSWLFLVLILNPFTTTTTTYFFIIFDPNTLGRLQSENTQLQQNIVQLQNEVTSIHQTSTEEEQYYMQTIHSLETQIGEL